MAVYFKNKKIANIIVKQGEGNASVNDGSTSINLEGNYDGTPLEVKQNQVVNMKQLINNRKIPLSIDVNVPIPSDYVKPSGTKSIVDNGEYDVKAYEKVDVNVASSGVTIPQVTNIALNDTVLSWNAPNYEELEVLNTSYLVSVNSTELETEETSLDVASYLIDGSNTISVIVKATLQREGESITEIVEYSKPQLLDVITKMGAILTNNMYGMSSVSINDKAYIFGGTTDSVYFNTIQCYDPINKTCINMNTVLTNSMGFTSAVNIDNKAYIFGGNNGSRFNTIQCYDPINNTITTMNATLTTFIDKTSAVNINNKAYIFGGYESRAVKTIQCYDPTSDTITTMSATLIDAMYYTSAVNINGKAYIFGGRYENSSPHNKIQCYDPTSDTITTMNATLTQFLFGTSAVNINNKAYIFGGIESGTFFNKIQCYDPISDTCIDMNATLVKKLFGTSVVNINNKAYVFGGYDSNGVVNTIQRYE